MSAIFPYTSMVNWLLLWPTRPCTSLGWVFAAVWSAMKVRGKSCYRTLLNSKPFRADTTCRRRMFFGESRVPASLGKTKSSGLGSAFWVTRWADTSGTVAAGVSTTRVPDLDFGGTSAQCGSPGGRSFYRRQMACR